MIVQDSVRHLVGRKQEKLIETKIEKTEPKVIEITEAMDAEAVIDAIIGAADHAPEGKSFNDAIKGGLRRLSKGQLHKVYAGTVGKPDTADLEKEAEEDAELAKKDDKDDKDEKKGKDKEEKGKDKEDKEEK